MHRIAQSATVINTASKSQSSGPISDAASTAGAQIQIYQELKRGVAYKLYYNFAQAAQNIAGVFRKTHAPIYPKNS